MDEDESNARIVGSAEDLLRYFGGKQGVQDEIDLYSEHGDVEVDWETSSDPRWADESAKQGYLVLVESWTDNLSLPYPFPLSQLWEAVDEVERMMEERLEEEAADEEGAAEECDG